MNQTKVDFVNKLCNYFARLPFEVNNCNICVCLSGGADSVSLLQGLLLIREKFNFKVSACHFNHLIRGEEAERDEQFCKMLCDKLSVKLYCGRDDVPAYAKFNKMSLEEAARECRYAFFNRITAKNNIDYCATAHNKNDDAETLLLNLIRGSGVNGASAIAPYTNQLLRPMLDISREEIESFLEAIGQEYVTDSTNLINDYTRNFIRNVLIPNIKTINPSVIDAFTRFTQSYRTDKDYFDTVVSEKISSDLRNEHKAVRTRVILKKCKDFCGKLPNSNVVEIIDNSLFNNNRYIIPIFNGIEAVVCEGNVSFHNDEQQTIGYVDAVDLVSGENQLFGNRVCVNIHSEKNQNVQNVNKIATTSILSFDNIFGTLRVRNRRTGDRIFINGMHKSVKKLFIEKKVPKEYRDIIPIIFDDKGILYIPFVGIADRALAKNGSKLNYITAIFNNIEKERWSNAYEKQGHK